MNDNISNFGITDSITQNPKQNKTCNPTKKKNNNNPFTQISLA